MHCNVMCRKNEWQQQNNARNIVMEITMNLCVDCSIQTSNKNALLVRRCAERRGLCIARTATASNAITAARAIDAIDELGVRGRLDVQTSSQRLECIERITYTRMSLFANPFF